MSEEALGYMLVMFCGAGALDLGVIRPLVCLVITQRQLKSGRQQISPEIKESMAKLWKISLASSQSVNAQNSDPGS